MARIADDSNLQAKPGVEAAPAASVRELAWTFLTSACCVACLGLLALAVFMYEPGGPDGSSRDERAAHESNGRRSR